jgi:hypothetical protein
MTDEKIIDLNRERQRLANDIAAMLYQRIRDLCDQFFDEDHDTKVVVDALLRVAASISEDVWGEPPEDFFEIMTDVVKLYWPSEGGRADMP